MSISYTGAVSSYLLGLWDARLHILLGGRTTVAQRLTIGGVWWDRSGGRGPAGSLGVEGSVMDRRVGLDVLYFANATRDSLTSLEHPRLGLRARVALWQAGASGRE